MSEDDVEMRARDLLKRSSEQVDRCEELARQTITLTALLKRELSFPLTPPWPVWLAVVALSFGLSYWMDATPAQYANRLLTLGLAGQVGWSLATMRRLRRFGKGLP